MSLCKNPILPGFYPDPSVCRVNNKFYLITSTFAYFPAVPIFESENLVDWKQIGNVLDKKEQIFLENAEHSQGIFAPTIRYNNGTWYMITTNISNGGNFFVTADKPEGPWSEPYFLGESAKGIDPSLFFDDDGKCYYIGTRENPEGARYNGDWEIWAQEIDLEKKVLVGQSPKIWKGSQLGAIWPEGPHIYKKDGYYYLLHAEGGTSVNHCIVIARSKNIFGPYENNPKNPIFTHRHLGNNYPIVNVGHGDLVDTISGQWYMVMLASRPIDGCSNLGRETFLAKVTWEDDWPVVNVGKGVIEEEFQIDFHVEKKIENKVVKKFNFANEKLPYEFLFLRNPSEDLYYISNGTLNLKCTKEELCDKKNLSYISLRQEHWNFEVKTKISLENMVDCQAGIMLMQNDYNNLIFVVALKEDKKYLYIIKNTKEGSKILCEENILVDKKIQLNMKVNGLLADFYYGDVNEEVLALKDISLKEMCTEYAGGFVGCTVGMYAKGEDTDKEVKYAKFYNFDYYEL